MTKLLVIDKDLTLVSPKSGGDFVQSPEDQELLPGVKETIERYHSEGWRIVVVSNQGGVAAGYKSLEDTIAEFRYLMGVLPEIDCCYFCPDFLGRFCYEVIRAENASWYKYDRAAAGMKGFYSFRKPEPGMIQLVTDPTYGVVADEVLFVGDRPEDELAAKAAGIHFQWAHEFFGGAE